MNVDARLGGARDAADHVLAAMRHPTVSSLRRRGLFFVFVGAQGSGKSTALDLVSSAASHSATVIQVASNTSPGESVATAIEHLADAVAADIDIDEALPQRLRDTARRRHAHPGRDDDPVTAMLSAIRSIGSRLEGGLVIAFDDAHRLDDFSLSLLDRARARMPAQTVLVFTTTDPDFARRLPDAEIVQVTPLTHDGARDLLASRGIVPPDRVVSRVRSLAGGHPPTILAVAERTTAEQLAGLERLSVPPAEASDGDGRTNRAAGLTDGERKFFMAVSSLAPLPATLAARLAAEQGLAPDSDLYGEMTRREGSRLVLQEDAFDGRRIPMELDDLRTLVRHVLASHEECLDHEDRLRFEAMLATGDREIAGRLIDAASHASGSFAAERARSLLVLAWSHAHVDQHEAILLAEAQLAAAEGYLGTAATTALAVLDGSATGVRRLTAASLLAEVLHQRDETGGYALSLEELRRHLRPLPEESVLFALESCIRLHRLGHLREARELITIAGEARERLGESRRAVFDVVEALVSDDVPETQTRAAGFSPAALDVRERALWIEARAFAAPHGGVMSEELPHTRTLTQEAGMLLREVDAALRSTEFERMLRGLARLDERVGSATFHPVYRLTLRTIGDALSRRPDGLQGDVETLRGFAYRTNGADRLRAYALLALSCRLLTVGRSRGALSVSGEAWDLLSRNPSLAQHDAFLPVALPAMYSALLHTHGRHQIARDEVLPAVSDDTPVGAFVARLSTAQPNTRPLSLSDDSEASSPQQSERNLVELILRLCERHTPSAPADASSASRRDDTSATLTEHGLSTRDSAIAWRAARGMRNREISTELFVSLRTVEATLTRVFRTLGVTSRQELAMRLLSAGEPAGPSE